METARLVSSPVLRFAVNNRSLKLPSRELGTGNSSLSFRHKDDGGILRGGFSDCGHLQYYVRGGGGKKQKEKSREIKTEKKKAKLVKRLSKDLDFLSRAAHDEEFGGRLTGDVKGKLISEATEVLLAELRHLRTEQKEQKKKRKEEERARQKAAKAMINSESSSSAASSSSESSDGEGGMLMGMSCFRTNNALTQVTEYKEEQANCTEQETLPETSLHTQDEHIAVQNITQDCWARTDDLCSSSNYGESLSIGISAGRKIEICMGGKCKKLGAVALLEEFERKIGTEAEVIGCKCMGKCKSAPNVRVFNDSTGIQEVAEPTLNPLSLCIGVGLEDVGAIVSNLLGKDRNDSCLMAAS